MGKLFDQVMQSFKRRTDETFQETMIQLGMAGLSLKDCGDYFGLDPDDWIEWCEENPITEARLNCGKARGIALAGNKLLQQINEGKMSALSFYLKTQGGFTEKTYLQIEETLKASQVKMPEVPKDPIEASKTYQKFMKDS